MTGHTLLVTTAALFICADGGTDAMTKEFKKLDGDWVLASGTDDGKALPKEQLKEAHLTFDGETHVVKVRDLTYRGTHKLDPTKNPKTIDITDTDGPFKNMTVLGIYEITGDEFRICYTAPGKDRPKDFISKEGTGYRSHIWKRDKN